MNTECIEVKEFSEILPELRDVLEQLGNDLIRDELL